MGVIPPYVKQRRAPTKRITEPKQKRKNRTIVLPLENTLAEYNALICTGAGVNRLIRRVEMADRLNWGHLADQHKPGCPRRHRFTHHHSYRRWLKHYAGGADNSAGSWSNARSMIEAARSNLSLAYNTVSAAQAQ
jgi:hypothetical protein